MNSDSLDELGLVNPVDVGKLSMESQGRIRGKVMDGIAGHPGSRLGKGQRLGVVAGVVLLGVVGIMLFGGWIGSGSGAGPGGPTGPISASCVDPYRGPNSIKYRSFAFDGTVAEINGDQVKFAVTHSYLGSNGPTVTLAATGMTGQSITSAGGLMLRAGKRYLVAGDDHFVWACGYTQPYDQGVAAQWAAAIGG